MRHTVASAVLAILLIHTSDSAAVEPAYREIQFSLSIGPAIPTGDWENYMETGYIASLDMGLSFTPRFSAGLQMGLGSFKTKPDHMGPFAPSAYSAHWARYSGGVFGEYRIGVGSVVPFIGGRIGMQGVYVSYVDVIQGMEGQGEHGFGYGISCGIRYRTARRYGFLLRLDAENSPNMTSGWFFLIQLGISFHL